MYKAGSIGISLFLWLKSRLNWIVPNYCPTFVFHHNRGRIGFDSDSGCV